MPLDDAYPLVVPLGHEPWLAFLATTMSKNKFRGGGPGLRSLKEESYCVGSMQVPLILKNLQRHAQLREATVTLTIP